MPNPSDAKQAKCNILAKYWDEPCDTQKAESSQITAVLLQSVV